jgi:hypothetical protein
MRLYRLHLAHSAGVSSGYKFFTTKPEAAKAKDEWINDDASHSAEFEEITLRANARGILAALNVYASHPDNG